MDLDVDGDTLRVIGTAEQAVESNGYEMCAGTLRDLARGFPSEVSNQADGPDHAPRVPAKRRN